jgi:hypothetical protein
MMPFWLDNSLLHWLPAAVVGLTAAFVQFVALAGRS